jgi:hypothetical protein
MAGVGEYKKPGMSARSLLAFRATMDHDDGYTTPDEQFPLNQAITVPHAPITIHPLAQIWNMPPAVVTANNPIYLHAPPVAMNPQLTIDLALWSLPRAG